MPKTRQLSEADCGTSNGHRYHRLILKEPPCEVCAQFRCGTEAEYAAHRKHGEPVCDLCRTARYSNVKARRLAKADKPPKPVVLATTVDKQEQNGAAPLKTATPKPVPTRLTAAVDEIVKQYGPGSVMRMGDTPIQKPETIPTGAITLDMALGIGGVPRGRIVEVYGPESSGKTTLALHIVAEAQKQGGTAAFIDAEHCLDPAYAENLGVNVADLYIAQPDTGEQALEIADMLIQSGGLDVLVVDSVAALVPKAELEGDMGNFQVGAQARLMSQALRKLVGHLARSRTTAVFLNQLREKIGVRYGSPLTTPGGRALKFYASVRIDMRRIGSVKHAGGEVGNRVQATISKNKTAPPFRKAEFDIVFGQGISWEGTVLDTAVHHGLITRHGSWYSHDGQQLGQGRHAAIQHLRDHPQIARRLATRLRGDGDRPLPPTA